MTATVPAYVKLLASHHPTAELWTAETTLTPRDQYPGPVTQAGSQTVRMRWQAIGEYESGADTIYLGVSRSGYTDAAGRYVWASNPVSGPLYGWDPMTHVSYVSPIDAYAGASPRNAKMSVAVRGDGGLVCITDVAPSGIGAGIRLYTRSIRSDWATLGDVTSAFTLDPTEDYPAGYGACPVLARGEDGATYAAIAKPALVLTDRYVNVSIYRAPVSADWMANPFVPYMESAITAPSVLSGCTGLGFAIGGGQMSVIVENAGSVKQYAGIMGGELTLVETYALGTNVRIRYAAGRFVVAYLDASNHLRVRRLGSAFDALSGAVEVSINGTWAANSTSTPAIWSDDDGTLYVAASSTTVHIYESRDGGVTWASNISAFAWTFDTATLDATTWRGGACMVASSKSSISGTGYRYSAHSIDLGGWTSWAIPAELQANIYGYRDARIYPYASWVALSDPSLAADVTVTEAGAGTATKEFTSGLDFSITTAGGKSWKIEADATGALGAKATALHVVCNAVSSSVQHVVSNGTHAVQVNQSATSLVILDAVTSATLDTVTIAAGMYELWIIVDKTAATYQVFGRADVATDLDARLLASLSGDSLTAGTPTEETSSNVPTGREIHWREFATYFIFSTVTIQPQLPYGRPISASGTWTTNGISFAGDRGPAAIDDFLVCSASSLYGLDKVALTESYPSLREHFRSANLGTPGTASTPAYLAFTVATADADYLAPIVAAGLWSNAQQVVLEARVAGSWVSVGTAKSFTTGTGTGKGNTIHAVVATAGASFSVGKDDFAGGWIQIGTEVYTIAGNSPGLILSLGEGGTQVVFRTTTEIATAFTAQTIKIVPPHRITAWGPASAITGDGLKAADAFRFTFSGTIPPEGYWKIKAAVGFADVLGLSHGLNTLRSSTPSAVTNITRSGIMRRERTGPPVRTVEFSWQDITDPETPQTREVLTATPDRIDDSYGNTLAIAGTTYSIVRAYVEDHGSTGRPVMYVPSYDIAAKISLSEASYGGAVAGVLSPDTWITEHAEGREEQHTDHLRGGTLKIIEVS